MSTKQSQDENSKKARHYQLGGVLMIVAGAVNVGASFATEKPVFAMAGLCFFVASIFYFLRARSLRRG